jgi:hypothetical protein
MNRSAECTIGWDKTLLTVGKISLKDTYGDVWSGIARAVCVIDKKDGERSEW